MLSVKVTLCAGRGQEVLSLARNFQRGVGEPGHTGPQPGSLPRKRSLLSPSAGALCPQVGKALDMELAVLARGGSTGIPRHLLCTAATSSGMPRWSRDVGPGDPFPPDPFWDRICAWNCSQGVCRAQRTHMAVSSAAYVGNGKGKVLQISFSCSETQWAI